MTIAVTEKRVTPNSWGEAPKVTPTGGKSVTPNLLVGCLGRVIDGSGIPKKMVAADIGVPPQRLSALLNGDRPWTLERVCHLDP
jgi:hypothetical protein